ncbi:MAG TPA: tetratricopeptide repeat protein [Gemmatimonadales bacterium]|nr:tetratricopeptide repeat protein [Gemmatimonadales bacterium]
MNRAWWLAVVLFAPLPLAAQQDSAMARAFELERRGNYSQAADAYRALLAARPADASALLGLERALTPLGRETDILPQVRAALAVLKPSPTTGAIFGVALRSWAAAGVPDSLRSVAERWAAMVPGDETPYREWGAAALSERDRAAARQAYTAARQALHRDDALAAEMAQLDFADGDFAGSLREWLPAVRRVSGYRTSAVSQLSQAPDSLHQALLSQLGHEHDLPARRLEADLRARWGDPLGALESLQAALPADTALAVEALRGLADQLRTVAGREGRQALGRALEDIADRTREPERSRTRLEAARAYAAAGQRDAARRMLTGIAEDRGAPGTIAAGASATLIQVLIGDGKLDEASARLAEHRSDMAVDDYTSLERRLVRAYIRAGDLAHADSLLAGDSTVDGLALAGRVRLYRGDIPGAIERFKAAGPFAGEREEATERTALLAMLQPIEADTVVPLGQALLALARGDTARAVAGLDKVGKDLPPDKGGAEIYLLAGRLAAAAGKPTDAERMFKAAAVQTAPGTAPAAELALSELLLDQRRPAEAVAQLEHLILTYPSSALVPQARRRLDEARGGVPQT